MGKTNYYLETDLSLHGFAAALTRVDVLLSTTQEWFTNGFDINVEASKLLPPYWGIEVGEDMRRKGNETDVFLTFKGERVLAFFIV